MGQASAGARPDVKNEISWGVLMKRLLSWSLVIAVTITSHVARADCFSEARECRSDALDKRNDCLGECDPDDQDCRHECRVSYAQDTRECAETRATCLADERASPEESSPIAAETRQPSQPSAPPIYYSMVSPPVYAPNGAMIQRPVYQAFRVQPNMAAPPMPLSPNAAPGPCPSSAYAYHALPPGTPPGPNHPRQLVPLLPNALCR